MSKRTGLNGASGGQHRIEKYLDRLLGYALSLDNPMDQARELVQTCAVNALSARSVPCDEAAYRAWLFRIMRNAHIDKQRQKARRRDFVSSQEESNDDRNTGTDVDVFSFERRQINQLAVRDGLARLKPEFREILILVDMVGFSYQEAAELVGIPIGTVMSRLSRARSNLLGELGGRRRSLPIRPQGKANLR